ncbi:hypothetical protein [Georgenia sp. AZ-5]|uniref:hypothetical protein n=1 Tax=Georgenia sp. AZ-5 TaxID=3367526 RepID=UPI0037544A46
MLLSLGFGVLVLALVLVVASASAVHIERKRLLALADAAAADAADAMDVAAYYAAEGSPATRVPLSDASVDAAVRDHLAAAPMVTAQFDDLRVAEPTGTPDGTTAQVTLTAVARPSLVPWALVPWADGVGLRVTASARAG